MAEEIRKSRNSAGEGSFRIKPNGRYEFRFTYEDELGNRNRKSVSGASKDECLDKAEDFMRELAGELASSMHRDTIVDVLKRKYKKEYEMNLTGRPGYYRNLDTLRMIEKKKLGSIPMTEVTVKDVEQYLISIKGYSNSVIGKSYRQVKQAFRLAFATGMIGENIMETKNIRCPKSDKADRKVVGFTEHEQARFVEALEEFNVPQGRGDYKLQLLIELYSGLRMGEINALKESDIDFEGKILHVRRTVSRGKDYGNFIKEGGKTLASVRDVPISENLAKVLRTAVKAQMKNPEGLLFYNFKEGRVVSTSQVNNFFARLCTKYNLPFYGQHALRHTFATRCIESGVQPIVLKNWMGHKSVQMTLDIYSDVFNRMHMDSIKKFDEHVSAIS